MASWLGYSVSIKSKNDVYQGEIIAATDKTITLSKPFCNGMPAETLTVTLMAANIEDLKLIDKHSSSTGRSTITVAKPVAKRMPRSTSESSFCTKASNNVIASQIFMKSKPIDIEPKQNAAQLNIESSSGSFKNGTPSKSKGKMKRKDEACFGSPLETSIHQDFDFEKNLALFNKQAVWDEINASQKPDVLKHTELKKPTKYRHDENVIETLPLMMRQIRVPDLDQQCEYVSDDGLIIPCISSGLRTRLYALLDRAGLSWERRTELTGRAATEMTLQLLGGGHRLNPHNTHQWPLVVVLCTPDNEGAVGVNSARQLASHGVHTIVHVIHKDTYDCFEMQKELVLYSLSKSKLLHTINSIPPAADLIITAFNQEFDTRYYPEVVEWINSNRAAILALDPPTGGSRGIFTKYSLVPILPLAHSPANGKLYLCNLSVPVQLFNEVGIKYKSPFGPKFVIPLHPNDT